MNEIKSNPDELHRILDTIMKQILDLGQSSLSDCQFKAFRKMTMDFFADGKRCLLTGRDKGRCGQDKEKAKGVVHMDG